MDFTEGRGLVQRRLDEQFADDRESPKVLPYGFDTGDAWAPLVDWDGALGVYVYLVDKATGELTPVNFPDFADMPDPERAGKWPATNRLPVLVNRSRERRSDD